VIIGAVVTFFALRPRTSVPGEENFSLAIVDFRDLATPDDLTVSASMTELVNIGLIESSPIRIVSSEYLHDLRRRLFGEGRGPIEDEQALEVARKAGAMLLLVGRIGRTGDSRFVTWRLVDTQSGENLAAQRVEGNNLAVAADEVIGAVLPAVARRCGVEIIATTRPVDELTTESPEAYRHYVTAVLAMEWQRPEEALGELTQAVALDSTFALAHFELGRLYWVTTATFWDFDATVENINRAWALRSRLGIKDRLRLEGFRYDMDRRLTRAVDTYNEILNRWPDDRQALRDLSNIVYRYWDFHGAVEIHEKGMKLYPDDPTLGGPLYYECLVYVGRPRDALRATQTHVDRNPDEPSVWGELASRYLALGLPDSAEAAYRKAQTLQPDWGGQAMAYCAYHAGDLDRAITVFEQYLEREDIRPVRRHWLMMWSHGPLNLAALYREAGQYQKVVDVCEEARQYVSGAENIVGHQFTVGRLLLWIDRPREALDVAEELSKRDDTVRGHWYGIRLRARALTALGDLEAARAAVQEIYGAEDRWGAQANSLALEIEADIALADNDPEKAMVLLEKRKRLSVPSGLYGIDLYAATALAHRMAGRGGRAVEFHRELLRFYGGHALSHYELGQLYEEMSRPRDAAREYAHFLEMWAAADEGLSQLVDARARLIAMESSP
jgi:tetratricopeptide (TPR) repeat protein